MTWVVVAPASTRMGFLGIIGLCKLPTPVYRLKGAEACHASGIYLAPSRGR